MPSDVKLLRGETDMIKRRAVLGLAIGLLLLFSGCGNTEAEQVQETQAPVEKEAPAQADKSTLPMTGETWPTDWVGSLPEPDHQTVQYKVGEEGSDFEGSISIELKGMADGDAYIAKLIELGYSSMTNMKIGDGVNFIGVNDEESVRVQVTYNYTTKECSIVYGEL